MKVDDWLDVSKNETSISGYAPRNKRMPATPFPGKQHKYSGQKASSYALPTEKFVKQNKEKQVEILTAARTVSGVISDKPPTLKDLFDEESRSSLIVPSDAMNDSMMQSQGSLDGSSIEDDDSESSSLFDISYGGLQEYEDENDTSYGDLQANDDDDDEEEEVEEEVSDMYLMQTVKEEMAQCSETFIPKNSGEQLSTTELGDIFIDSKEDAGLFTPDIEEERQCEEAKPCTENGREEDTEASSPSSTKEARISSSRPRSQRALFMDDGNKELKVTIVKSQEIKPNKGVYIILKHKLQLLCAIALLGLGLLDLGLDDNFFYGLML